MKSLTIGIVSPYSLCMTGGVQEHIKSLGSEFVKLGHKVVYLSPDSKNKKLPQPHVSIGYNLRVPSLNGSEAEISISTQSEEQINNLIKKHKIDILHFQELLVPMSIWPWLKYANVAKIGTFHASWENKKGSLELNSVTNYISSKIKPYLDKSITTSTISTKDNYQFLKNNVIIPPAIDVSGFSQFTKRPEEYKKNNFNLVFLGRLDERKGAQYIVPALAKLPKEIRKKTVLHIIGEGPKKTEILADIKLNKLEKQVVFHGKLLGKVAPYIQHADIFLAPATHGEGFGMVLIEALAAGCPLIAGNNSGYKQTLKDYPLQQYIVSPTNKNEFSKAISSLLTNKKHQKIIKKWATKFVNQYSAANVAKQHLDVYKNLLQKKQVKKKLNKKHKIAYYELGDPNKETCIILHGHRSDAARLLPLGEALTKEKHIIIPDLPGSGDSLNLKKHTIDALAKKISDWINDSIQTNYSLVGLSMGGSVIIRSLKYLKSNPQHLYFYGTPTCYQELTPNILQKFAIKAITSNRIGEQRSIKMSKKIINNKFLTKILVHMVYPFSSNETVNYEAKQWTTQKPKALIETINDLLKNPLLNEKPSDIATTYISAKHDTYLDDHQIKKNVKKILRNTTFKTIDLDKHVPKGPLTKTFLQPFIDEILKN